MRFRVAVIDEKAGREITTLLPDLGSTDASKLVNELNRNNVLRDGLLARMFTTKPA